MRHGAAGRPCRPRATRRRSPARGAPSRGASRSPWRSEEHTSELQSRGHIVCRLLREKKNQLFTDMPRLLPQLVAEERNIIQNAIKFSHEKGVVTLSMKRQGSLFNISVAVRGIVTALTPIATFYTPCSPAL